MESILTQVPNTLIGWIATIFVTIGAVFVFFNRKRTQDLQTLRDTNKDLTDRVDLLEKGQKESSQQIELLKRQIELLKTENKSFQDLIVLALDHYFQANPAIAIEMKGRLKK